MVVMIGVMHLTISYAVGVMIMHHGCHDWWYASNHIMHSVQHTECELGEFLRPLPSPYSTGDSSEEDPPTPEARVKVRVRVRAMVRVWTWLTGGVRVRVRAVGRVRGRGMVRATAMARVSVALRWFLSLILRELAPKIFENIQLSVSSCEG